MSITPADASRLVIAQEPSASATAGVVFPQQPVVRIEDVFGNLVTSDNTTVVAAARLQGTGTLQGTTTATASGGLASFTNLSYQIAEQITIRFSSGALVPDTSSVVVVGPAAPSQLQFVQQPTNTPAGQAITPAVTVRLLDQFGNAVPTSGTSVTVALSSGSGSLSGTTTQATNTSGIATFSNLSINLVGTKQLTSTSTGLSAAVSNSFSITPAAASRLVIAQDPSASATAGVVRPSHIFCRPQPM